LKDFFHFERARQPYGEEEIYEMAVASRVPNFEKQIDSKMFISKEFIIFIKNNNEINFI
jgi:hypothetical protein